MKVALNELVLRNTSSYTDLPFVVIVGSTGKYKTVKVNAKYNAHSYKNDKVVGFWIYESFPNCFKVDRVRSYKNISSKYRQVIAQTLQSTTASIRSNLLNRRQQKL